MLCSRRLLSTTSNSAVLNLNKAAALVVVEAVQGAEEYADLVRQCGEKGDLGEGRRLHHQYKTIIGLERNRYVDNLLIQMYGKCGCVADARGVFDAMPEETRNIFSWNIMLTAYAQNGDSLEALLLFNHMLLHGVQPSCVTWTCLISSSSIHHRHQLRHLLTACGITAGQQAATQATGTALLDMYGRWGEVHEARRVFDHAMTCEGGGGGDTVIWNAMISAYAHNQAADQAEQLFRCMLLHGVTCNHVTFLSLCSASSSLHQAKLLHALVAQAGYDRHPFIANCLVNLYARCGSLADARNMFEERSSKEDVISWNTIISAYSQHAAVHAHHALHLFHTMLALARPQPDRVTFLAVLDACTTLQQARRMHSLLLQLLPAHDVKLRTVLINTYSRCGSMEDAAAVARAIRDDDRDVVCWNSIMAAYAHNGGGREALQVLRRMDLLGCKANKLSLLSALEACASTANLANGRRLHHRLIATGCGTDVAACSALVSMYGRCRSLADARAVFREAPERNVVTWTAFIAALVDNERDKEATVCFRRMEHEGIKPNQVTLLCTIDACANGQALHAGLLLHRRAQPDFSSNVYVANSLINMYGKCGRVEDARAVFDEVVERDMITWNALMSGLAQNGQGKQAVETYWRMMAEGVRPDRVTFITVLDACATLGSLPHGRAVHRQLVEGGFECVDAVIGTLVNMYGRCGSARDSKLMFDKLQHRDVVAWNSILAQGGQGREAIKLLQSMEMEGVKPDPVTFITLLDACADHNALAQGKQCHARVVAAGLDRADVVVGNALLNMYGKCGSLSEARAVFDSMADRNLVSWNTIIVAYSQNGHVRSAIDLFREMDMEGIFPNHVSFITILSACSHAGLLDQGRRHFQYMTGDHGMTATAEHYGCFVDLLARNGRLEDAEELVTSMPVAARSLDWAMLLASSAVQANAERAERAVEHMLALDSKALEASPYVRLSNMYAAAQTPAVQAASSLRLTCIAASG